jgi:N-formylmaleamate deformylase
VTGWISRVCEANGIHYLRTGGVKPSLVLLHGLTGNGACWTPLAHCLEDEYDVVMPDARGHGNSSAPLQGYTYGGHAADVIELIRELTLARPILLGHSMGAEQHRWLLGQDRCDLLAQLRLRHPHRSPAIVATAEC